MTQATNLRQTTAVNNQGRSTVPLWTLAKDGQRAMGARIYGGGVHCRAVPVGTRLERGTYSTTPFTTPEWDDRANPFYDEETPGYAGAAMLPYHNGM